MIDIYRAHPFLKNAKNKNKNKNYKKVNPWFDFTYVERAIGSNQSGQCDCKGFFKKKNYLLRKCYIWNYGVCFKKMINIYYLFKILIWDARTRHPTQRTRVRRGRTWRRERDAADRASMPRRATWLLPNRANAAEISTDVAEIGTDVAQIGPTRSVSAVLACIGRNGRVRPKFKKKKKKKKVQNAPFDLT